MQVDHFGLCDQHGADDSKLGAGAQAPCSVQHDAGVIADGIGLQPDASIPEQRVVMTECCSRHIKLPSNLLSQPLGELGEILVYRFSF